ncbi:MAG: hypothetical protein JSW33_11915 [bacterium]|nr:MAG: hypothetical protein JSW33_11915 [bacterium]
MQSLPDLKKIEKQIYQSVFQDGIYDITWGFLMLALAFNPLFFQLGVNRNLLFMSELILAAAWLILGKRSITFPRMGIVKPSPRRQQAARRVMIAGILLFLILVLLILVKTMGLFQITWNSLPTAPLLFSLFFLIVFTILALVMSYYTLFVTGLLFALSIPISELLYPLLGEPLDTLLPFGISALIILGIGFFRLIHFIRQYPKTSPEDIDAKS